MVSEYPLAHLVKINFAYTRADKTDISKTFERVRKGLIQRRVKVKKEEK